MAFALGVRFVLAVTFVRIKYKMLALKQVHMSQLARGLTRVVVAHSSRNTSTLIRPKQFLTLLHPKYFSSAGRIPTDDEVNKSPAGLVAKKMRVLDMNVVHHILEGTYEAHELF